MLRIQTVLRKKIDYLCFRSDFEKKFKKMTGCSRILFSIQNLSYLSKCFVVQKFQESRGMEQE